MTKSRSIKKYTPLEDWTLSVCFESMVLFDKSMVLFSFTCVALHAISYYYFATFKTMCNFAFWELYFSFLYNPKFSQHNLNQPDF